MESEIGSLRSNQRSDASLKSHLRSEDGQSSSHRDSPRETKKHSGREPREHSREHHGRDHGRNTQSVSNNSSTLFNSFKSNSSKAVQNIGKGIWAKVGRSGSMIEKEPPIDDEHYVLKVINLPLVEQTRLTRISKKLEKSRDKTEFWMPAFPWRAIDYLNYKGSEVEGLYRVPGSGPQIKKWQRKFDEGEQHMLLCCSTTILTNVQNTTSICLRRKTYMTSTSLDQCSKHGYVSFPTRSSPDLVKNALPGNARVPRQYHKCS